MKITSIHFVQVNINHNVMLSSAYNCTVCAVIECQWKCKNVITYRPLLSLAGQKKKTVSQGGPLMVR